MGEGLVQLGGERELRIDGARHAAPQLAPLRLDVAVERGVDLQHVDVLRQVFDRMLRLLDLRRDRRCPPSPCTTSRPCRRKSVSSSISRRGFTEVSTTSQGLARPRIRACPEAHVTAVTRGRDGHLAQSRRGYFYRCKANPFCREAEMIDLKKKCWREKVTAEITVAHVQQFAREVGSQHERRRMRPCSSTKTVARRRSGFYMMQAGEEFLKANLARQNRDS